MGAVLEAESLQKISFNVHFSPLDDITQYDTIWMTRNYSGDAALLLHEPTQLTDISLCDLRDAESLVIVVTRFLRHKL